MLLLQLENYIPILHYQKNVDTNQDNFHLMLLMEDVFACEGDGVKQIEMQFLSDVYVKCDECKGKRYNSETLSVLYKGKNISDVLQMTVYEALTFFENVPSIQRKLQTVNDVGLGYIKTWTILYHFIWW